MKGVESGDTLWSVAFNCDASKSDENTKSDKAMKEITAEIQAIVRQITASVTFLPLINGSHASLICWSTQTIKPLCLVTWEDSDLYFIANGEDVWPRSFTTKIHQVGVSVSYKVNEI